MSIAIIMGVLSRARLPLNDEKRLQVEIEKLLASTGLHVRREVTLAAGDVVDFMADDIAIEVKIKGQRRAILRQCERYAAHETVGAIILVTNVAMGFPATLHGKPTAVLNLGRAWL